MSMPEVVTSTANASTAPTAIRIRLTPRPMRLSFRWGTWAVRCPGRLDGRQRPRPGCKRSRPRHGYGPAARAHGARELPMLLPARRLVRLVEPDVEEVPEVAAAHLLGEGDELPRGDAAEAILLRPAAHDAEEREVADLLAQRLQRHPAAVIDRAVEQERRRTRVPEAAPESDVLRRPVVELVEPLRRRLVALVLAPDPLRPRGEPLVQPDVRPSGEGDRIAVPHVGQLVGERRLVGHPVEDRLRLRLQR